MARIHLTITQRKTLWAYIFLAPSLVFFAVIVIYPVLESLRYSFFDWPLGSTQKEFIGLENYTALLLEDQIFHKAVWNTILFTAGTVVPTLALALALAMLMNKEFAGRGFFRTVYFVPVVSSLVAVGFVWVRLLEPSYGLVNQTLRLFGIRGPGWLSSPQWALPAIMLMSIWRDVGYYMVIFLAGLQTIPRHLYEAAVVDGANAWQRFWKITLPLLNPTIVFCAVIGVIYGLHLFTQVYVMTGGTVAAKVPGGPAHATRSVVLHIVQDAFRSLNMGYASAAAFLLFAIIFIFTLIQIRLIERSFEY